MSTKKALADLQELVKNLEDREGTYSPSELQTAAILKAAHIIGDSIQKLSQPSGLSCLRQLLEDRKEHSHGSM